MALNKKAQKMFWREEAKEKAHAPIKKELEKAGGEKKHKKKHDAKKPKGAGKIKKVMEEFAAHKLHSGSKKGPEVTNPKQALAIGYSEKKRAAKKKK